MSISADGRFLLRHLLQRHPAGARIRILDLWDVRAGRGVPLPAAFGGERLFRDYGRWRPGGHVFCLAGERSLVEYDVDSRRESLLPLPPGDGGESMAGLDRAWNYVYLDAQTLVSVHRIGAAGYRVYRLRRSAGEWLKVIEEGITGGGETARVALEFWLEGSRFDLGPQRILLGCQGDRIVRYRTESSDGLALATPWGVLRQQGRTVSLRDWETDAVCWRLDREFDYIRGFAWEDRALLLTRQEEPSGRNLTRLSLLRIPEGTLEPLAMPVPDPCTGWIEDSRGPAGLLSFHKGQGPNVFYRLDLRDGRLVKVLELDRE